MSLENLIKDLDAVCADHLAKSTEIARAFKAEFEGVLEDHRQIIEAHGDTANMIVAQAIKKLEAQLEAVADEMVE